MNIEKEYPKSFSYIGRNTKEDVNDIIKNHPAKLFDLFSENNIFISTRSNTRDVGWSYMISSPGKYVQSDIKFREKKDADYYAILDGIITLEKLLT